MPTAVAKTSVADEPSVGVGLLRKDVPEVTRFSDPRNFINRELSWLEFNRRVLEEAQDPTQPLIERVKFLTIFSSNLDEFFEIRVAGIKQQIESETSDVGPDGLSATETFNSIQRVVRELVATQYALWKNELVPELAKKFACARSRNCRRNGRRGRIVIFSRKSFQCSPLWLWMPAIRSRIF